MPEDPVVERFYSDVKDLLIRLASTGYVVTSINVEWLDLSSLNQQNFGITSITAEMSHKIK